MAAKFTISAVIKAVDKVTAPIAAINRRIESTLAPVKRLGAAFGRIGKSIGDNKIVKLVAGIGRAAFMAVGKVLMLGSAIAGLAGGGVLAILLGVSRTVADVGDEVATTATKLGIGTTELQEMRFAADKLDVSQEALDGGLKKMSRSMVMASKGAKDQAKALRLLGYTDQQIRAGKISVADATMRLAKRMEDEKKSKSNAIIANTLYGKSYLEMMPMLKAGGAEIARQIELAHKYGVVMSEEAIKSAEQFDDANKDFKASLTGLRNVIGAKLLPVLTPLLMRLANWVALNRQLIASKVEVFINNLTTALKNINWERVGAAVSGLAEAVLWLGENFKIVAAVVGGLAAGALVAFVATIGLIPTAIIAAGAAIAVFISKLDEIEAWFKKLGWAIGFMAKAWANDLYNFFVQPVIQFFDMIIAKIDAFIGKIGRGITAAKEFASNNLITRGIDRVFGDGGNNAAPVSGLRTPVAAGVNNAQANVVVDFRNAPAGTRVKSDVQGRGLDLGVDVGYQTGGAF